MIPVRVEGLAKILRTFPEPGRALVGSICPACDEQFWGGPVTLVHIGPGSDPEDQEKARAGRWHTGDAVAVHSACAGLEFSRGGVGMIELDGATALRLLREVVAERPDYVYKAAQGDVSATCLYVEAGSPSCVVGHVLARAGCPIDVIRELDSWGSIEFAIGHVDEILMDASAVEILKRAQLEQDYANPWSAALAAAEDRAFTLGVTA